VNRDSIHLAPPLFRGLKKKFRLSFYVLEIYYMDFGFEKQSKQINKIKYALYNAKRTLYKQLSDLC
jgi:hypothetical protein